VRCLTSVRALHWPQHEVELIYVDSASQDDSLKRARDFDAHVIEARPARPCAAVGRNLGWRRARAPFVLFLDGDTILHPDFAAKAMIAFDDPHVAVVWGHRRELYPHASLYQRVLDLDWVYAPGTSLLCGGDALMRRAVLAEVGGYDEGLIAGEEPELCQRLRVRGYLIHHVDVPMTQHDLAISRWSQYWRRAERAGYAYAAVVDRGSRVRREHTSDHAVSTRREAGRTEAETYAPLEMSPLWRHEARRNTIHAAFLGMLGVFGVMLTLTSGLAIALVVVVGCCGALTLRSAYRARWKSVDPITLLLYGIHAHVQQIPIFVGQLGYWCDCWVGQKRALMEYKEVRS
jgi:cellulose synthase/poly-beta-1,6-N-acetylglucosamine synthase-like glycosyltransferase